jgi:hypothetical protein
VAPYWIAALVLSFSEMHRLDVGHLQYGSVLLIVLFFNLCEWEAMPFLRWFAFGAMVCLTVHALIDLKRVTHQSVLVSGRRGQLWAQESDGVLDFLQRHTAPGDNVFIYPYLPRYYFWADVKNPTRFSVLLYHFNPAADFQEAVRNLETERVKYVLWCVVFSGNNLQGVFPAYRHPPRAELIMEPYLESRYHQIGFAQGVRILERNQ